MNSLVIIFLDKATFIYQRSSTIKIT